MPPSCTACCLLHSADPASPCPSRIHSRLLIEHPSVQVCATPGVPALCTSCTLVKVRLRPAHPSPPRLLCWPGAEDHLEGVSCLLALSTAFVCSGVWFLCLPRLSPRRLPCGHSGSGTEGAGGHKAVCEEDWGVRGRDSPPPGFPAALNKKYIYIKNIMENKKNIFPPIMLNIKRRFLSIMRERFWP